MRHVLGFVLGVILAPALAYGAGWGFTRAAAALDPVGRTITDRTELYGAFALMAAVGLVLGVVIVARWVSPLATLIPALAMIGWTVYFVLAPKQALDLPGKVPPAGELDTALQALLVSGMFALIGFALLVPMWVPRRWRGRERADDVEPMYQYS
jgi:hypothetical protein